MPIGTVACAFRKAPQEPVAEVTEMVQLPEAGAVPRTVTDLEGWEPVLGANDTVLGHLGGKRVASWSITEV